MRAVTLKSTVLSQAEAKGSTWNSFASSSLRLRQHYQILTSYSFPQEHFF